MESSTTTDTHFDWQGHRGCRGLMPENSLPAFVEALKYPVTTLELDVVVSADTQLVVSHEPWMNPGICLGEGGASLKKMSRKRTNIHLMTVEEIRTYDCGSKGREGFPRQQHLSVYKPTLSEVVNAVRNACAQSGRAMPAFNIELKSRNSWYGTYVPEPVVFIALVLSETERLGIRDRAIFQSFDMNVLRELHRVAGDGIMISYLTSRKQNVDRVIRKLGFVPDIYSPAHTLVTPALMKNATARQIRVIPWTVNDVKVMQRLITMGVDGIITDYPDLIPRVDSTLK